MNTKEFFDNFDDDLDETIENEHDTKENNVDDKYEMVNHPTHYNKYDVEVIEMMRRIWGDKEVASWAKLTAFKYRMRLGEKPNNSIQQDLDKEKFYLDYVKKLKL